MKTLASLADIRIAELVRAKLISGNSVPVERCTIFAKEIAKIDEEVAAAKTLTAPPLEFTEQEEAELDAFINRRRRTVQNALGE